MLLFHCLLLPPLSVGCLLSWAVVVCYFCFTVYCCPHCVCRLCIVLGGDCDVVVSLFIAAPIVCEGCVLSQAVIVLLLLHCLLLPPLSVGC